MIPNKIKNILLSLEQNGYEAYLVGGFVRDAILHKKTNDFDIATNALPRDIVSIFGPPKRDIQYGSYNLKVEDYNIDITTYRKEGEYTERRNKNISYTTNLLEDAKRRDFTINAIYMNKNGEIIDPLDGQKDLKKKVLRVIGNPKVRLEEDPIRILRAIRFQTLYHLKLENGLKKAILERKYLLKSISDEMLKKELDKILLANGFGNLKKYQLLKELEIENKKIVYVGDLAGLWAQIKTEKKYLKEKNERKRKKSIEILLKCGTMSMLDLYQYGYYDCLIAAQVMHFPVKKLEVMYQKLPIKSRKDIAISFEELAQVSQKEKEELGILYQEIEVKIIKHDLENNREKIIEYVKER